jgi:hypothetical protein
VGQKKIKTVKEELDKILEEKPENWVENNVLVLVLLSKKADFLYTKRAQPKISSKYCKCTGTCTQPMRNAEICGHLS